MRLMKASWLNVTTTSSSAISSSTSMLVLLLSSPNRRAALVTVLLHDLVELLEHHLELPLLGARIARNSAMLPARPAAP